MPENERVMYDELGVTYCQKLVGLVLKEGKGKFKVVGLRTNINRGFTEQGSMDLVYTDTDEATRKHCEELTLISKKMTLVTVYLASIEEKNGKFHSPITVKYKAKDGRHMIHSARIEHDMSGPQTDMEMDY